LQRLVVELLEVLRNLLIFIYAGEKLPAMDLTEAQVEALRRQKDTNPPEKVLRMIQILTETESQLRYALSKRTLLETALIRCARAATVVTVDEIVDQISRLKKLLGGGEAGQPDEAPAAVAHAGKREPAPRTERVEKESPAPGPAQPAGTGDEIQSLLGRWHEIVQKVGILAPLAKNCLIDAKPVDVTPQKVRIGFDPEFAESKEKIDFPRNIKAVQKVLSDCLERSLEVEFFVMDASSTLPGDTRFAADEEREEAEPAPGPPPEKKKKPRDPARSKREWIRDPVVRKTLELFNGQIVDIRE
jgi:DNA polymerase-3 subunit gamma/tau